MPKLDVFVEISAVGIGPLAARILAFPKPPTTEPQKAPFGAASTPKARKAGHLKLTRRCLLGRREKSLLEAPELFFRPPLGLRV